MTAQGKNTARKHRIGVTKGLLLTVPMVLLSALMLMGEEVSHDRLLLASAVLTLVLLNGFFFLMLTTGNTHRYRSILFITVAFCFIISFMTHLIEIRGSIVITKANIYGGETPFCHLVIPSIIIPAAVKRTIIFPGSLVESFASIGSMIVLWIGVSLALGRGWCSWGCFFGGLDEGFSRIPGKPLIKKINPKWRYLPHAVLLAVVLTSAVTLSPTYCAWLCPFKAVTEFAEITSFKVAVQTVIFVSLFVTLVVALPILTKRRIQCGLFCPFGAFQSFTNKLNVFDVRIDVEKCVRCGRCIKTCPTFSLDESSVEQGRTLLSCTKCGRCVDACPKGAITYHIKGTPVGVRPNAARLLFLYPAFILMSAIGGSDMVRAVWRVLKLVTTGEMI